MRILLFSREFPPGPGGIGAHAYQLTQHLTRLGWEVEVMTPQDYATEAEIREFNAAQPFSVMRLSSRRGTIREAWHRRRALAEYLESRRPAVVIATGQRSVWLAAWVCAKYRVPWLAVGHGTEFGARRGWQLAITRWAFERTTATVCVSQYTRGLMLSRGIRPSLDFVIPNGADEHAFGVLAQSEIDSFRGSLGWEAEYLLLTVGNVTERKGQEVVIRALPQILTECPKTHYVMAGLPTLKPQLTALAESLGVAGHVHFLGRLDARTLLRQMNACDVFVMTSRLTRSGDCEGFGIAAVEAALCGKPAVVTQDSGLSEAIVDGRTGLTAPENDATAVARAVIRLLRDPSLRSEMGIAARQRALKEQTWTERAAQYDQVIRQISGRDAPVPPDIAVAETTQPR